MEEAEIRESIAQLERVWGRVRGGESPPPAAEKQDGAAALGALIDAQERAASRCRALSRLTRGRAASQLLSFAAEHRREARELQEQFFLLTGDSRPLRREAPEASGLLLGLRRAWTEEAALQRDLTRIAETAADDALRTLCLEARRRSAQRQARLRALLRSCMRE